MIEGIGNLPLQQLGQTIPSEVAQNELNRTGRCLVDIRSRIHIFDLYIQLLREWYASEE